MARAELVRRSDGVVVSGVDVTVSTEVFDNVLSGNLVGDSLVPVGERWLVGSPLTIRGNLRTVGGVIVMRGAQP